MRRRRRQIYHGAVVFFGGSGKLLAISISYIFRNQKLQKKKRKEKKSRLSHCIPPYTRVRRWVIEPMQVPIIETQHSIY